MLYSRPFLEQRIKEEQFRTYRTGSPFSVVFLNPFRLFSDGYISRKKTIDLTVKLLDQETRETDIKGWWDRRTFAVLLLDTPGEKALLFIDKLVSKVQENSYGSVELIRKASFKIISFPNTGWPKSDGKDNKDKEEDLKGPKNYSNKDDHKINSLINVATSDFSTGNGVKKHQEYIKRCLDIVFSVAGLIILSPFLLVCALLIKLDSPGPVFYRQTRVSRGGKGFTFLKFRSMKQNVDEEIHVNHVKNLMNGMAGLSNDGRSDESSYKLPKDDRVTRVGKFLRKTSIDELPQLINVLKGDMSLVGPRPHPVYEVEEYNLWHSHRLDVKSGITGLGQVYGRFNTGYEDVYRLDLRYLKRCSLILDLKILFKTIPVVLSRRGAR
jgi:lipopolysaccharide/colanic/teichoic acid biosynthesis glycosyltransferase/GGDEF domain-containing protein